MRPFDFVCGLLCGWGLVLFVLIWLLVWVLCTVLSSSGGFGFGFVVDVVGLVRLLLCLD